MKKPVACIAIVIAACQAGKEKGGPMSPIQEFRYWSSAADESLPMSLEVSSAGSASLWVRSNRDRTDLGTLGHFRTQIPATDLQEPLSLLGSAAFDSIRNPGSIYPGEVVRKIMVRKSVGELTRYVAESAPAPDYFVKAEQALLKLGDQILKHPEDALSFKVDALPGRVTWKQDIRFSLTLSNPGRQPLRIAMPSEWEAVSTQVEMKGIRTDIPLAKLDNSHSPDLDLGHPPLIEPDPGIPAGTRHLILEPGKSLAFAFKVRLPWEPGPYAITFTYAFSLADGQGNDLGRMEWVSAKQPVEVSKD